MMMVIHSPHRNFVIKTLTTISLLAGVSCAYHFGSRDRVLPGGYDQIAVPLFSNKSEEPGIEIDFTNAMIREIERSGVAQSVPGDQAPVTLSGKIESIEIIWGGPMELSNLGPSKVELAADVRIVAKVHLAIVRTYDKKVLWSSLFTGEKSYATPRVSQPVINSVNPLYEHSARLQNISRIAQMMMSEAFYQMTENF